MKAAAPWLTFASRVAMASAWHRAVVLLLLALMSLSVGAWWGLHAPQQSLQKLTEALRADEARLRLRQTESHAAQAQALQAQAQHAQWSELEAALPEVAEAARVWPLVYQASRAHNLQVMAFKPGVISLEKPYAKQRATLKLSGSFESLQAFMQAIAESESALSLETWTLSHAASPEDKAAGQLVFEGVLVSLLRAASAAPLSVPAPPSLPAPPFVPARALGSHKQAEPPAQALMPASPPGLRSETDAVAWAHGPDPFASQRLNLPADTALSTGLSAAGGVHALQAVPLAQMRMVGMVSSGPALMALVRVQGVLHPVRQGDQLGTERAVVLAIEANGLRLQTLANKSSPSRLPTALYLPLAKEE